MLTFEQFLEDMYFDNYTGTKDDFQNDFNIYMGNIAIDTMLEYGDDYAKYVEEYVIDHLNEYLD